MYNLDGGTLSVYGGFSSGSGSSQLNLGGGTFQARNPYTVNVNTTLVTGTNSSIDTNSQTLGWSAAIGGAGNLTKIDVGTLTLTGADTESGNLTVSGGTLVLDGPSTSTGNVILDNGGTLALNYGGNATASALGTGSLIINGGNLDNTSGSALTLATNNTQIWNSSFTFTGTNSLSFGTGAVTLGSSPTVTVNAGNLTAGAIGGSGFGLTKSGAGTLTLGAPSYTGGTTVTGGTLAFTGSLSNGNTTVTGSNSFLTVSSNFLA
ncbi:MAG: autotransporter-associated beta strand repeat-containing protein, partial [Opitutales bacterium]